MKIETISGENRARVNDFLKEHWYTTNMIVSGRVVDMTQLDGFAALEGCTIVGLVTYETKDGECEIISLDSLKENHGTGTALLREAVSAARRKKCRRVKLITTNDNINAIRFYQKRGFDMAHLYHNAMDVSRKLKPSIPLVGDNGIPLRHEIEFELSLR